MQCELIYRRYRMVTKVFVNCSQNIDVCKPTWYNKEVPSKVFAWFFSVFIILKALILVSVFTKGLIILHVELVSRIFIALGTVFGVLNDQINDENTIQIDMSASLRIDAVPIGIIYLNITPVLETCNTLLLRRQWSLGPAHCMTLISQPDLFNFLHEWRIKYRDNDGVRIKKCVVHPHFDTDTFENNIGVIHHDSIGLQENNLPNTNYKKLYNNLDSDGNLVIISWLKDASLIKDNKNHIGIYPARLLPQENCLVQMAPIVDLRSYETCAVFEKVVYTSLGHGALALQINTLQVFGIFTWGETLHRTFPLVILNLSYFQEWVDIAMTL